MLGADQRRPFPKEVEAAILKRIRAKEVWEGFVGIGRYGFRGQGYHEKAEALKAQELQNQGGKQGIETEERESLKTPYTAVKLEHAVVKSEGSMKQTIKYESCSTRQELPTNFPPTPLISEAIEQINLFDASLAREFTKPTSDNADAEINSGNPNYSNHPNR